MALVTGAGSGIGRGLALALARRSYHILLAGRDPARLKAAADEVGRLSSAEPFPVDLADPAARAHLINEVLARYGAPDLLVNNAAVRPAGEFLNEPVEVIERTFALNLAAPAVLARRLCAAPAVATPPAAAPSGAPPLPAGVIFVLSTAARFPQPYSSLYCSSKTGLRALAECLQVEYGGSRRVCLAYPPLTRTAMTESAGAARLPLRMAGPEQVGERIIDRYEAGQDEITWFDWEALPVALYRLFPAFFRWVLKNRRAQLRDLLRPPGGRAR